MNVRHLNRSLLDSRRNWIIIRDQNKRINHPKYLWIKKKQLPNISDSQLVVNKDEIYNTRKKGKLIKGLVLAKKKDSNDILVNINKLEIIRREKWISFETEIWNWKIKTRDK